MGFPQMAQTSPLAFMRARTLSRAAPFVRRGFLRAVVIALQTKRPEQNVGAIVFTCVRACVADPTYTKQAACCVLKRREIVGRKTAPRGPCALLWYRRGRLILAPPF